MVGATPITQHHRTTVFFQKYAYCHSIFNIISSTQEEEGDERANGEKEGKCMHAINK